MTRTARTRAAGRSNFLFRRRRPGPGAALAIRRFSPTPSRTERSRWRRLVETGAARRMGRAGTPVRGRRLGTACPNASSWPISVDGSLVPGAPRRRSTRSAWRLPTAAMPGASPDCNPPQISSPSWSTCSCPRTDAGCGCSPDTV